MGPRSRTWLVLLVAAIGGAGTMTVELAAVRVLSPWFGSSLVVWTNVIAVVLLALSLGYLLGGRLSRSGAGGPSSGRSVGSVGAARRMGWLLLFAGLLAAWLPFEAALLAPHFVPAELELADAAEVVLWGSLALSLLLFLPPAVLLGAVAPLAVQAEQEGLGGTAGEAGGRVLAASTVGSLAGVFGTSHVFLPGLGLRGTFLLACGAFLAAGALALVLGRPGAAEPAGRLRPRARDGAAALLVLFALGSLGAPEAAPRLRPGLRLLAGAESPYQSVRIVADDSGERPLRLLQVNEGTDSFQSAWQEEPGLLPEGFYYNAFALPPWWTRESGTWRVLVLGLGGGTALRVLEGAAPAGLDLELVGVELDPLVVALAREHLDLAAPPAVSGATPLSGVVAGLDARVALRLFRHPFDEIVLDCYANQVEIPAHLCTVEFFRELRRLLAPGAWLVTNLGGFGFEDPVVQAVAATCAAAFEGPVLLARVPLSRNFALFAREGGPLPVPEGAGPGPTRVAAVPEALRGVLGGLELGGAARLVAPPATAPLRDDHAPVEALQLRSILEARREGRR